MPFVYVFVQLAILFKHLTQCIGEKDGESVNRNNLSDKLIQQIYQECLLELERESHSQTLLLKDAYRSIVLE